MDTYRKENIDSGGVQEGSTYFGAPCLTVRDSTERPITVNEGKNKVIDTSYINIVKEAEFSVQNLWDGKASERIRILLKNKYLIIDNSEFYMLVISFFIILPLYKSYTGSIYYLKYRELTNNK